MAPIWSASAIFSRDEVYNEQEARWFASLSQATYCDDKAQILNWTCQACRDSQTPLIPGKIKVVDSGVNDAMRLIIGKLRDQPGCLLSFRGTKYATNIFRDMAFWKVTPSNIGECPGCKVHSGFYKIWTGVKDEALAALEDVGCSANGTDNKLYITGHSMGGALTHLAMFALKTAGFELAKTYTFEAPRTGNKAFAEAFANKFGDRTPVFRVTHMQDPIPHLPPTWFGYQHVQKEVYYYSWGNHKDCAEIEDPSCANRYSNVADMALRHTGDHCSSALVATTYNFCFVQGCDAKEHQLINQEAQLIV